VTKVRERLEVGKETAHRFHVEFNPRKLNEVEGEDQHREEI
jgi:hypothetical protein